MAFIVGVVFVVGALISLSDGDDILGVVATNNWTTLIMGAGGAALIVLSMMPRVGRRRGGAPVATRHERDRELDVTANSTATANSTDLDRDRGDGAALRARAGLHERPRDDDPAARSRIAARSASIARSTSARVGCGPKPVRHHVAPASSHGVGSVPAGFVTTTS